MTPEELQAELDKVKAENAALTENVKKYQDASGSTETMARRVAELEAETKKSKEENQRIRLDLARENVIKEFPNSALFKEHLVGANEEEIKTKAKSFHEAVSKQTEAAVKAKEEEIKKQWGNIPSGGLPGMLRTEELDAKLKDATEKRDIAGMMKAKVMKLGSRLNEALAR